MRLLDRMVLRELLFPFAMAVVGFVLFILLNLILQLSDFMIDRDVAWSDLVRVLAYKLPELVVVGLPIAVLFAVFLALGRLKHDREVIALQAGGISLRRVVAPVIVFGLVVSLLTFVLNEGVTPWANRQYQILLRQMLLRGSVPQIRDNTFFKDDQGRFFYVRRYDPTRKLLQDVLVFDPTGRTYLPEVRSPYPQLISARRARWEGTAWVLSEGIVHQLDEQGALRDQVRFETLRLEVGEAIEAVFLEQRTPREMSLRELGARIAALRASGYAASELVVAYQDKLVVPLGALVFALFAAPLSLSFGTRGRASGVVISVLLTGGYQGALFWVETLARRELLSPVWGPWLPNLLFGGLGLLLTWHVDRFSRLAWGRWRGALALAALLLAWVVPVTAQERPPLEVRADALELDEEGRLLRAQGQVRAVYGEQRLAAAELRLRRLPEARWWLVARGAVTITTPDGRLEAARASALLEPQGGTLVPRWLSLTDFVVRGEGNFEYGAARGTLVHASLVSAEAVLEGGARVRVGETVLSAERLVLSPQPQGRWRAEARGGVRLSEAGAPCPSAARCPSQLGRELVAERLVLTFTREEGLLLERAEAEGFRGQTAFENAQGQTHTLRFAGRQGTLLFAPDQRLRRLELEEALVTTCTCEAELERASYALGARHVVLWPQEWVLGRELSFRVAGVPLFWTPLFLAPLRDLQENPLLPQLGRDPQRGWFARWRLPAFVDRGSTGALLLDLYGRYRETGLGLDWNYARGTQAGRLHLYHLVGPAERLELDWAHRWTLPLASLEGTLRRRLSRPAETGPSAWSYSFALTGGAQGWRWRLAAAREEAARPAEGEPAPYRVLERLPELSLSYVTGGELPWRLSGSLGWGRYREQRDPQQPWVQTDRLEAAGQLSSRPVRLTRLGLELRGTSGGQFARYGDGRRRASAQVQLEGTWRPSSALQLDLDYLYRAIRGRSPLAFDALEVVDRLSGVLRLGADAGSATLSARFFPEAGRWDPLVLNLSRRQGPFSVSLSLQSRPAAPALARGRFQGDWRGERGRASLQGGYDFTARSFEDLIVKVERAGAPEGAPLQTLRLGARLDPRGLVRRVNAELAGRLGPWGWQLAGEFDFERRRFSALQVGLVRHLCHDCWQVGLYLTGGQLWLGVQINAFPEAALRYAPADGALSFAN